MKRERLDDWPAVSVEDFRAFIGWIAVVVILGAIFLGITAVETPR